MNLGDKTTRRLDPQASLGSENDDPGDGYPYDEEDNSVDEFEFDCGMDRSGNCGKAGSEECDWECPYRNVKRN